MTETQRKRQNEERAAIKRVLLLVGSFLAAQWDRNALLANTRGTLLTSGELRDQLTAAARLSALRQIRR